MNPYRCWEVSKLKMHIPEEGEFPPSFLTPEDNEEIVQRLDSPGDEAEISTVFECDQEIEDPRVEEFRSKIIAILRTGFCVKKFSRSGR